MTARQDRQDVEEAVALVLANGGPVDDERDAAAAVLAELGGVVKVQWRIVCALQATDPVLHSHHAYTKPSPQAALKAAASNDKDSERIGRPECAPWRVQRTVVLGWVDAYGAVT